MAAAATFGATNTTTATATNKEYDYNRSFNHEKSSCSLLTPPRHHHNSPLRSRLFPHRKLTPMTTSSLAIPGFWPNVGVGVSSEDDLSRTRSLSFACTTAVRHLTGSITATEGLRFVVVVARFNEIVTKLLLEGALDRFKRYSVKEEDIDALEKFQLGGFVCRKEKKLDTPVLENGDNWSVAAATCFPGPGFTKTGKNFGS